MDFGYILCAVWLIICLVDLHNHNKKIEKMFPEEFNPDHRRNRDNLTISFYPFGFLLVMLIVLFIKSCFGG